LATCVGAHAAAADGQETEFLKHLAARQRGLATRTTALHVKGNGAPAFKDVQEQAKLLYADAVHPDTAKRAKGAQARPAAKAAKPARDRPRDATPIIVVPNSATAMIGLGNVAQLLAGFAYAPPAPTAESEVRVEHTAADGSRQAYRVIDSTHALRKDDWARIVAVFASGQDWQFKDWDGEYRDATYLFHHARGFYLQFSDDLTPPIIASWNVHVLKLNRERRHLDSMVVVEFWKELERFRRERAR
jgi:parafibromin